jgi:SSS family solute:Na+ symporter
MASSSTFTLDFLKGTLVKDMTPKQQLRSIRVLIAVFILISSVIAIVQYRQNIGFIAQFMGISWGALAGAFLAPFLYGLYWKRATKPAVWCCFGFSTVVMLANLLFKDAFPAVLQSSINAGAFVMLAGLVIVPVVSLLTRRPDAEHVAHCFAAYDRTVTVKVRESLGGDLVDDAGGTDAPDAPTTP